MTPIDAASWLMLGLALSAVVVRVLMWCDVERAPSKFDVKGNRQ